MSETMGTHAKVQREVAALGDLPRQDLIGRWAAIYRCPPPPGVRRELLLYAAAWHLQTKRLGGFSPETKRRLKTAVEQVRSRMIAAPDAGEGGTVIGTLGNADGDQARAAASSSPPAKRPLTVRVRRPSVQSGARLLRDWNGRTHVVDVTEGGFLFDGKSYRSLSAIARQITGAQWSGPRFFGL